jgi:hypothetical protein
VLVLPTGAWFTDAGGRLLAGASARSHRRQDHVTRAVPGAVFARQKWLIEFALFVLRKSMTSEGLLALFFCAGARASKWHCVTRQSADLTSLAVQVDASYRTEGRIVPDRDLFAIGR